MAEDITTSFIGHIARLKTRSETSYVFELLEQHSDHSFSLRGWVDIHYPCTGRHLLVIRTCLDPQLVDFTSIDSFGGTASDATAKRMRQLVDEVCEFLNAGSCESWHLDLNVRGVGTSIEQPQTLL